MQVQEYTHASEAIKSFNFSKTKKFNKRNASNKMKQLCKILLRHKYENEPERQEWLQNDIHRLEKACSEFNWGTEFKEKRLRKIHKEHDKDIDNQIKKDMMYWTDWNQISFQARANGGPIDFCYEHLKYAITENGDLVIYGDCYQYDEEALENIINILTENNIVITSFIKKYPNLVGGGPGTHRPKCTPWEGEEPGHDGWFSIHRGNLVGFIIQQNNV